MTAGRLGLVEAVKLLGEDDPVPARPCQGCGGVVWRQRHWFQCPDCGCKSTANGGCFPSMGIHGEVYGAQQDFVDAVNKSRKIIEEAMR